MTQDGSNMGNLRNPSVSDEIIKLPDYTNHGEFARWVLSSRANMCCLCRDGKIDYINPVGAQLLQGADQSEFIGQKFEFFVDPIYREMVALGLDMFTEEPSVPLKLLTVKDNIIDVTMTVSALNTDTTKNTVFLVECNDITQLLLASESARRREQRTTGILLTISDAIIISNDKGIIQSVNPAAETMFGYEGWQLSGKNVSMLMPDPIKSAHDTLISNYLKTEESKLIGALRELIALRSDGIEFPIEITINELKQDDGHRVFTAIIRDITARKRREAHMTHIAHHDALTGLPNRHLFEDRLEHALNQAKREKNTVALLYIDLDKFKPINDTLGHEAGDMVLKEISQRLLNCSRASDTVARVGGDEFVVILEPISHREDAGRIAKSMLEALTAPVTEVAEDCIIGASIGISIFPDDATEPQTLMNCADATMYRVKKAGRNNYLYFEKNAATS